MKMSNQLYIKAQIAEKLEEKIEECELDIESISEMIRRFNNHDMTVEDAERFDLLSIKDSMRFQRDFIEVINRLLDFMNTMDLGRD